MGYIFVSYSEEDDRFDDVKSLVSVIERQVHRDCGVAPDIRAGRSSEPGSLSNALKNEIEGAAVFLPVFSNNYTRQAGTAWRELVHARSLVGDVSQGRKPADFIIPILFRASEAAFPQWAQFITDDLNCIDLNESWAPARQNSEQFHSELKRLSDLIKARLYPGPSPVIDATDAARTREDINRVIKEIAEGVVASRTDNVFSDELVYNILEDVKHEIRSISDVDYRQDISLGRSFIVRARAIFRPASSVIAVSLDSSSDFWTGDNTHNLALDYTHLQPENTKRLFIFSSPASMLMHRWVLSEHFRRYGSSGKVMMTSLSRWQWYLRRPEIRNLPDLPSLTEDFGILTYAGDNRRLFARLSANDLSFRSVAGSKFMSAFSGDVDGEARKRPHADGPCFATYVDHRPMFWTWLDGYSTLGDDLSWLRCVADVFDGDIDFGPSYKAAVMHNVLFNPPIEDGKAGDAGYSTFERFIKEVIFSLLQMKVGDETLVKSIWFGRYANEMDVASNDPIHQNRLLREPSVWKFCLSMTFQNQDALRDFYEHPEHAQIRRKIYEFLDPNVAMLYRAVEENGAAEESTIGSAIERIVSKYLLRMDYLMPDPYFIYRAVAAPQFASLEQSAPS